MAAGDGVLGGGANACSCPGVGWGVICDELHGSSLVFVEEFVVERGEGNERFSVSVGASLPRSRLLPNAESMGVCM